MRTRKLRILTGLLSLALLCASLPASALAQGEAKVIPVKLSTNLGRYASTGIH